MRRDMDLIREILLRAADHPTSNLDAMDLNFPGATEEQVFDAVRLLESRRLLTGRVVETGGGEIAAVFLDRITWEGHDFIESIRAPTVWSRTKEIAETKGVPLTIEVVKMIVPEVIKRLLGS